MRERNCKDQTLSSLGFPSLGAILPQFFNLTRGQAAIESWFQTSQLDWPVANPFQFHDRVPHDDAHSSNLSISPFSDGDFEPCILAGCPGLLDRGWCSAPAIQNNTRPQALQGPFIGDSLDLCHIGFGNAVAGMLKILGELSVICEDEEPLGVIVESSHRKDTSFNLADKVGRGPTTSGIMGCGENFFRLVQYDGNLGLQPADESIIYTDSVLSPGHLRA